MAKHENPSKQKDANIYLRNVNLNCQNEDLEPENCLAMRQDQCKTHYNDLLTEGEGESKIKWEVEKDSGIKRITAIYEKEGEPDLFDRPTSLKDGTIMKSKLKKAGEDEIVGNYVIEYTLDDGKETPVKIDPMIRIRPK